ncbi:MAG: PilW family protein [Sulfuricaulis sp.]
MTNARTAIRHHLSGFSLIELMVAMLLGILVSIGLVSLFGTTSSANKVQNALALLQENGRFAVTRVNADLRMVDAPFCSSSGGRATLTPNGAVDSPVATFIYFSSLFLPDSNGNLAGPPAGWPPGNNNAYPLSPSINLQGYECDKGGTTCVTDPSFLPKQGTTAGLRVPGSDAITLRYLQGPGWPVTAVVPVSSTACTLTATRSSTDPAFNFSTNDRLFVGVCNNPEATNANISVSGNTLTATLNGLTGNNATQCGTWPLNSTHVYNFSKDFVTITYYLRYDADPSPDAPAGRVIPDLIRRFNGGSAKGGSEDVVVQGVDRLDFLYGVNDSNGAVTYLTADKVDDRNGGAITCPAGPAQFQNGGTPYPDQTGCLWRAVRSIEVHMMLDTINNLYAISANDTPYCYSIDPQTSLATVDCSKQSNYKIPASTDFNGMPGQMMRREFVSLIGVRNAVL